MTKRKGLRSRLAQYGDEEFALFLRRGFLKQIAEHPSLLPERIHRLQNGSFARGIKTGNDSCQQRPESWDPANQNRDYQRPDKSAPKRLLTRLRQDQLPSRCVMCDA